jgi:hypothetical protein
MARPARALREKLGSEAMSDLQGFVDDAGRQWKDDMLTTAGERFERRLAEEIGALRVDMAKEFGALRVEMITNGSSMVKWLFLLSIGQVVAVSAMMAFLLKTVGRQ